MRKKIYCAGPLFNSKEKEEMQSIADILENNGYSVFLPQRDGFEFANLSKYFVKLGVSIEDCNVILNKAIFTLDVFQVLDSDGLILNINGRVPDEGAMVEAGIAWNAGKKIAIYKNDARTLINGNDNPLLLGLSNFTIIDEIPSIPSFFNQLFENEKVEDVKLFDCSRLEKLYEKGKLISRLSSGNKDIEEICNSLIEILEFKNVFAIQ